MHLDIKPQNILLNNLLDETVIIDYGISKLLKDNEGLTLTKTYVAGITYKYTPLE